jgi:hypothetical protein
MANDRLALQDLIENPPEVLDVELKDWIDIKSGVVRADIARHIAALANNGGGHLLFGFRNDRTESSTNPYSVNDYNRDAISGIVKKYLVPTFQCDVDLVTSRAGIVHPVVWVPSHRATPICSKADGPHDDRRGPQGIKIATYYTRAPGPESMPIQTPEHWAPIIRRCIVHERTTLVGMFDSLLRTPAPSTAKEILRQWHERADHHFVEIAPNRQVAPTALKSRVVLSYAVHSSDNEILEPKDIIEQLRLTNQEMNDLIRSPILFHPYTRQEMAPHFAVDAETGQEEREFLEWSLFPDVANAIGPSYLWRVSLGGLATQVSTFWEDSEDLRKTSKREPGTWFYPFYMVRSLAELVRHARAFSGRFKQATSVEFRCEWFGLAGREIFDPWPGRLAMIDYKIIGAIIGPLAAAYFGAYSAQRIIERRGARQRLVKELRSINIVNSLAFHIANVYFNIKKKHVKGLYESYHTAKQRLHEVAKTPSPKPAYTFKADLGYLESPVVPIDQVQSIVAAEISARGRPLVLPSMMAQAIRTLTHALLLRNDMINAFPTVS